MIVQSRNIDSAGSYSNDFPRAGNSEYPHFSENWRAAAAKLPQPSPKLALKMAETLSERCVVRFSHPGNPIQDRVEKLCAQSGLNALQKMLLSSSYDTTMRKLREEGVSPESQDPDLILQRIVKLAARFEQNLSGEPSNIVDIVQWAE